MNILTILACVIACVCTQIRPSVQDNYDGHYDLKARDAAYLCVLMEEYLKTGKQPDLTKTSPEKLEKKSFTKGKPCWRFNWIPCDAAAYEHMNQKPCGWYQMDKAPEKECN